MTDDNKLFNWVWARRILEEHFGEFVLIILIGVSILLACFGDAVFIAGVHGGADLVTRGWLREQTALLVGALLGKLTARRSTAGPQGEGGTYEKAEYRRDRANLP